MRRIGNVLVGVTFMLALIFGCLLVLRLAYGPYSPGPVVTVLIVIPAAAGLILVRWPRLSWRQLVAAALLAGVLTSLTMGLILPSYGLHFGDYPGVARDVSKHVLLYTLAIGSGVFLLPLFDPIARTAGPAPRVSRVALTALGIIAGLAVIESSLLPGRTFGLGTLVSGALTAVILAGVGFLLTLGGRVAQGAWAGGLGLLVAACAVLTWLISGAPWFP